MSSGSTESGEVTVLEFYCGIGGLRYAYEMATARGVLPPSHPLNRPAKIISFDISLFSSTDLFAYMMCS